MILIFYFSYRRQGGSDNITRNFIKFLTSVCGLLEVRHMVLPKLEMWIMNPKISRAAQELLMAVAMNCNTHSHQDVEVIGGFTKFRFKNKPNINLYLSVSLNNIVIKTSRLPIYFLIFAFRASGNCVPLTKKICQLF